MVADFSTCLDPVQALDVSISELIKSAGITKNDNTFFQEAKKLQNIDPYPAMVIAANWREITKTFMFTTLIGIGKFAQKISSEYSPDHAHLQALQTSVAIISDDINNTFSEFSKKAPKGLGGIHYIWWDNAILSRLQKMCNNNDAKVASQSALLPATLKLTEGMIELSQSTLGFAVQLRIVEAIALDICLAFRPLFAAVIVNNVKLFPKREDLDWIYTHITAEVIHHKQVKDHKTGMVIVAQTDNERDMMIQLSREYIKLWADVFDEFSLTIKPHC